MATPAFSSSPIIDDAGEPLSITTGAFHFLAISIRRGNTQLAPSFASIISIGVFSLTKPDAAIEDLSRSLDMSTPKTILLPMVISVRAKLSHRSTSITATASLAGQTFSHYLVNISGLLVLAASLTASINTPLDSPKDGIDCAHTDSSI